LPRRPRNGRFLVPATGSHAAPAANALEHPGGACIEELGWRWVAVGSLEIPPCDAVSMTRSRAAIQFMVGAGPAGGGI
jgi:hypothetical protein